MFEVVCINGNYHVNGIEGNSRFISTDKNALIKEIAARIGVSILTSDEIKKSPNPESVKVEIDIKIAERILMVMKENFRADYSTAELDTAIVNAKKQTKNKILPQLESTTEELSDWNTATVTHDGIQFNKHFIELKLKVQSLETEILKLK